MKNILLLLLISTSTFAQNLTINQGDVVTINSNYDNISFNGKGKLIVNNNVRVNNINTNGKAHITVNGDFTVNSSINLTGDTLIVYGKVTTGAIEIQGQNGYLYNTGEVVTTQSDIQINNQTGVFKNCGTVKIKQSFNINSGRYIACNCSSLTSYNINPNGVIEGQGSLKFTTVNLNKTFTNSPNIYVYYTGSVNNHLLWGTAVLNSPTGCNSSLPVKLSLFKVGRGKDESGREIIIINTRFEDFDKMRTVRIQRSSNGKNFTTIKEIGRSEFKLNEIQTFTILK